MRRKNLVLSLPVEISEKTKDPLFLRPSPPCTARIYGDLRISYSASITVYDKDLCVCVGDSRRLYFMRKIPSCIYGASSRGMVGRN